jgi:hypothetical protein
VPVFIKADKRILFVHVPKAGGTTIERLFKRRGYEVHLRTTRKSGGDLFPLLRCSPQHYHAALLTELVEVEAFDLVFMMVREPLARFRSEYAMRRRSDLRTDAATVERWAHRALAGRETDPYVWDNHLRPQSEFLLPGARVFRLEDGMEAAVEELNTTHGLDLGDDIPHALHRQGTTGISSKEVELSGSLEERLGELYAEDFRAFGY